MSTRNNPKSNEKSRSRKKKTRHVFTKEEDNKLISVINKVGDMNWNKVASLMKPRTARQCKERWTMYLSPYVNKLPWTDAEDQLLIMKYKELGPKWTKISKSFYGRSDNAIKNHWNSLNRRLSIENTNPVVNFINSINNNEVNIPNEIPELKKSSKIEEKNDQNIDQDPSYPVKISNLLNPR